MSFLMQLSDSPQDEVSPELKHTGAGILSMVSLACRCKQ